MPLKKDEGGWLISEGDTQALSEKIQALIRTPQALEEAGKAGRERVENHCSWENYKSRFMQALQKAGDIK